MKNLVNILVTVQPDQDQRLGRTNYVFNIVE